MNKDLDPVVDNWYRHLDKGQMFRVVAFDESDATIELQLFDGDIEEVNQSAWQAMDLELVEAPEDWTGPMDDIERDDLGYSETEMSGSNWREPLQETPRKQTEAWEDAGSDQDIANAVQGQPAEELWEPNKIDQVGAEYGTLAGQTEMVSPSETSRIKQSLLDRSDEVRADIRRELRKCDDETYSRLADRVTDSGEQSWSDLLVDINLAEITRDVTEFRDIEAALLRLAEGNYGLCVSCEEPIDSHRLDANPAAARCLKCQQAFEKRDRQVHHHSI
jgi:RNA polymerase-binding transcription factor DksA